MRLLTTPAILKAFGVALTNHDAIVVIEDYLAKPAVGFAQEPGGIFDRWKSLADLPTASPKRWMDAYLAAFAMQAGLQLVTADNDFKHFLELHPIVLAPSGAGNPSGGAGNVPRGEP